MEHLQSKWLNLDHGFISIISHVICQEEAIGIFYFCYDMSIFSSQVKQFYVHAVRMGSLVLLSFTSHSSGDLIHYLLFSFLFDYSSELKTNKQHLSFPKGF